MAQSPRVRSLALVVVASALGATASPLRPLSGRSAGDLARENVGASAAGCSSLPRLPPRTHFGVS
jgi:hypothetical protein